MVSEFLVFSVFRFPRCFLHRMVAEVPVSSVSSGFSRVPFLKEGTPFL